MKSDHSVYHCISKIMSLFIIQKNCQSAQNRRRHSVFVLRNATPPLSGPSVEFALEGSSYSRQERWGLGTCEELCCWGEHWEHLNLFWINLTFMFFKQTTNQFMETVHFFFGHGLRDVSLSSFLQKVCQRVAAGILDPNMNWRMTSYYYIIL